jgi:hypothetical protein
LVGTGGDTLDIEKFEDGASVEWISCESLLYRVGGFSVQVVYDYVDAGAVTSARIVRSNSIQEWETCPIGHSSTITRKAKHRILEHVIAYLENRKLSVEVDPGVLVDRIIP